VHKYIFVCPITDPDGQDTLIRISVLTEQVLCRRRLWRGFRHFMKAAYGASIKKEAMRRNLMILHTDNFYVSDERVEQFIRNISEDYDTPEDIPDTLNQSTDTEEAKESLHTMPEGFNTTQAC
jgi:hypothetical protein